MTRIRFEDLPSTNTPRNAENLNKLNNVVISPTEPTTGEEVWIQKGKNLLSGIIEGYTLDGNGGTTAYNGAYITKFIEVQPNTSYVASGFSNQYKEWYDENFTKISNVTDNPAISPSNAKYLRMNGTGNIGNIQIEQGETATSYEPYIDKKIHTKNDNGVYEEFYKSSIVESGSNENGSWVKFADGTMICRHIANMGSCTFDLHSGGLYTDQTNGGYYNWKLPQYFIDRYVAISALAMSSAYVCTSSGGLNSALTSLNIYYYTNYACTVSVSLCMTAIGRWK